MAALSRLFGAVRQDTRHFAHSVIRSPAFATIAIMIIAIGVGITTSVVSIVDHVLVRGLPFRDSGQLMMMLERGERGGGFRTPSYPTAEDWRKDAGVAQAFEGVTFVRGDGVSIRVGEETETVGAAFVAAEFFPLLGVTPTLGRLPVPDAYRAGAPSVAVISQRLWARKFGRDPGVIGRSIQIDGAQAMIVAVLPSGASYPTFAELWMPIARYRNSDYKTQRGLHVDSRTVGRLKPGVDSARAVSLMRSIALRLGQSFPVDQAGWVPAMQPMQLELIGNVRPILLALAGAAVAVLVLVCANVASLLLVRATTRTRELAVRSAMGASRGRLISQLLAESFALAAAGGAIGIGVAVATIQLTKKFAATRLPRAEELGIDYRVLAIAAAVVVATALCSGLWPAIRATRPRSSEVLRSSGAGSIGVRADARIRQLLVTVQFALALVLLAGAGLLMQSFRRAAAVDVGLEPRGLTTIRIQPPSDAYSQPQQALALYDRLIAAARSVPGVENVAFINHVPFSNAAILTNFAIEGASRTDSSQQVLYRTASASYLETMRMKMAGGRWFDDSDMRSGASVFVINEALARRHWPGTSPVGRRITVARASQARADFGKPITGTIVGIVADIRHWGRDVPADPEVYVPYTLETWPWGTIVIRSRDAERMAAPLSAAIRSVDSRLLPAGVAGEAAFGVMERNVDATLAPRRLSSAIVTTFAGCALFLAALGMYGVISHSTTQRTRELGLRKALGATDARVAKLIVKDSLIVFAAGIGLGVFGAWAAARFIRSLLFSTTVTDPWAFGGAIALLALAAAIATIVPARHALRLDPSIAMRND